MLVSGHDQQKFIAIFTVRVAYEELVTGGTFVNYKARRVARLELL
jgi:hypothetical protein